MVRVMVFGIWPGKVYGYNSAHSTTKTVERLAKGSTDQVKNTKNIQQHIQLSLVIDGSIEQWRFLTGTPWGRPGSCFARAFVFVSSVSR